MSELGRRAAVAAMRLVEMGRLSTPVVGGVAVKFSATDRGSTARVERVRGAGRWRYRYWWQTHSREVTAKQSREWWFDLSDPLTVLGLLLLVREASGAQAWLVPESNGWRITWPTSGGWGRRRASTEAEALVLAIEALAGEG